MRFLLYVTLPLYLLDQATKWLISHSFSLNEDRSIVPNLFDLAYYTNTGAAFSIFTSANSNRIFICISILTLAVLFVAQAKGAFVGRLSRAAFALLVSGILGNLTDRLLHGHVIDFLLVRFGTLPLPPWPAFNVADSCICTAAGLFVIHSFKDDRKRAPAAPAS